MVSRYDFGSRLFVSSLVSLSKNLFNNYYLIRLGSIMFYGKKEEEPLNPNIEHQAKKNEGGNVRKEDMNSRDSIMLAKEEKEPGCCDKCCNNCCACLSLDYYKEYFKVTNSDVKKRVGCNILFFRGGFFDPKEQEYDLYGPFWLYTTMIFVAGAVHNVLIYQNNRQNFTYNFDIVTMSITVFYLLGFALSAIIGLIFGCLGIESKTIQIVCLYGYSMATYIICILLCMVNTTLATWILLVYAATSKVIYILKNIFESLEVPAGKKFVIMVIVIAEAAVQFMIIKFSFIRTSPNTGFAAAFSHMSASGDNGEAMIHFRSFAAAL